MRLRMWFVLGLVLCGAVACANSAELTSTPSATVNLERSAPEPSAIPTDERDNTVFPSSTPARISKAAPTRTSPTPTPVVCSEPGQIITGTYESAIEGPERSYRIWLPPCYGQEDRFYPTLYLLHGNVRAEWEWEEVGMLDSAEALIQAGDVPPLIIVMPDGRYVSDTTSGGPNSYEAVVVDELIPHIEATYCAAHHPRLRAIGGISRGGYWALEIAFRHPDLFASVGGHSASLYDDYAGPDFDPQYTGIDNELGRLRVYFDIGEDDYLIENLRILHEDMEEAGIAHVWHLNEGSHADPYWSEHVEEYLRWYTEPWQGLGLSVSVCDQQVAVGEVADEHN